MLFASDNGVLHKTFIKQSSMESLFHSLFVFILYCALCTTICMCCTCICIKATMKNMNFCRNVFSFLFTLYNLISGKKNVRLKWNYTLASAHNMSKQKGIQYTYTCTLSLTTFKLNCNKNEDKRTEYTLLSLCYIMRVY